MVLMSALATATIETATSASIERDTICRSTAGVFRKEAFGVNCRPHNASYGASKSRFTASRGGPHVRLQEGPLVWERPQHDIKTRAACVCRETKARSYLMAGWDAYGQTCAVTFEIGIFHDDTGCRSRTLATGELTSTRRQLFVLGRSSRHAGIRCQLI